MKLYTEEQVKQLLFDLGDVLFNNCQEGIEEGEPKKYYQELLNLVVPIELPSDEEIGKLRDEHIPIDEEDMWSERLYFTLGAKSMRDKIQEGEK